MLRRTVKDTRDSAGRVLILILNRGDKDVEQTRFLGIRRIGGGIRRDGSGTFIDGEISNAKKA